MKSFRALPGADSHILVLGGSIPCAARRPLLLAIPQQRRQQQAHSHHGRRRRHLHSSAPSKDVSLQLPILAPPTASEPTPTMPPPLSTLPLSSILRTYLITSISSSPALLSASTRFLRALLNSRSRLLSLDANPVLRALLWHTFYKQFCAGSTASQVGATCAQLRTQGYAGVILEYALEVLKDKTDSDESVDVAVWRKGLLASIDYAAPGDFVGLKWSGMGPAAMKRMAREEAPSAEMEAAMHTVCAQAEKKGIALLPAAEETWNLNGFHDWCLRMQRVYNLGGKSVVYSTYQAYLKQTPATLAAHVAIAKEENFTLGAKLVRGAYLASEKRELIWPTIEATHHAYDELSAALIHRKYTDFMPSPPATALAFPDLNVVLATHNAASVASAQALRRAQASNSTPLTPLVFAQLQGMADEVSCTLLAATQAAKKAGETAVQEQVFKCTTWGSMYECLNYLLRRAAENKDAAGRTGETRVAMRGEILRRVRASVGMA